MKQAGRRDLLFSCALVFVSGAAALIYEVAWARWIMLAVGAGAQSLALTAAGTMVGLALGNELGGRLADRTKNRLRLYGLLELGVAVSALATMIPLRAAAGLDWDLRAPLLILIIVVPNLFMGATLPALATHVGRTAEALRGGLARLYTANTAGAVLGTLAAGFFLVEHLGLSGSVQAAAALSAVAGAGALALGVGRTADRIQGGPVPRTPIASAALWGAGASGFTVMAHEVLDARFLVHAFNATTHAIAIILAVFIAGLAAGAALCSGRLGKSRALIGELGAVLLAGAAVALAMAPALAQAELAAFAAAGARHWGFKLACEALAAGVMIAPSALVMGFGFPLAAAAYVSASRAGRTTGRVFLVNTLAGAAGSLGAGFILLPLLGLRGALAVTVAVQAVAGAMLASKERSWPAAWKAASWGACSVLLLGGFFWMRPPEIGVSPGHGTLVPQHAAGREAQFRVLCYREGRLATTEVLEELGTGFRTLFIDGFVTAGESATSGYMALMGRLPMTLQPSPKRALVICLGGGATARAVAEWPEARIDLVDVNPDVFACAPSFGPANQDLLKRASSFVEDGRRFLRREGAPYDVITQEPMPPYFAGSAALYSVEYYRLARRRLSDDGIIAQWLPLHLTAPRDARQIVAAALAVFPETWVALAPGGETAIVIGSMKPLDASRRARAAGQFGLTYLLDPDGARRYAAGMEPVTDDRPALEYWGVERVRDVFSTPEALSLDNIAEMRAAAGG